MNFMHLEMHGHGEILFNLCYKRTICKHGFFVSARISSWFGLDSNAKLKMLPGLFTVAWDAINAINGINWFYIGLEAKVLTSCRTILGDHTWCSIGLPWLACKVLKNRKVHC